MAMARARLGVGTYRMVSAQHQECLRLALRSGFSVVDTSPVYGDGIAERLVGQALAGGNADSGVEVVSKFGFIQGAALEAHKAKPVPGAVEYTEDCWHSVHPDFMRQQLEGSLERLGRKRLETYLVHNPEHLLMNRIPPDVRDGALVQAAREELLDVMGDTFAALREEVAAGRVGRFGISSNSLALPLDHPHQLPLADLLDKGGPGLEVVQMPGNVIERAGLTPVSAGGNGMAQLAKERGVEVMVNRALTAFDEVGSWRLAEAPFPEGYAAARDELVAHLSPEPIDTAALSAEEREGWEETLEACAWLKKLVGELDAQMGAFSSVMHYQDDLMRQFIPMINAKLDGMDEDTQAVLMRFFSQFELAVRSTAGHQTRTHVFESITQDEALRNAPPGEAFAPPPLPSLLGEPGAERLQDLSLRWLRDLPCVTTVLVGAVRPEYVRETAELFAQGQ